MAKILSLIGTLLIIQVGFSRGDECTWSKEEIQLNCCDTKPDSLDEPILKKCAEELHLKSHDEVHVDYYDSCIEECIWKEENLLDADGKANIQHFLEKAKAKTFDSKEAKKQRINILEECIKEKDSWDLSHDKCKSGAHLAAHCIDVKTFLRCSTWKDTPECNAVGEKIKKCYDKSLMPPQSVAMLPN